MKINLVSLIQNNLSWILVSLISIPFGIVAGVGGYTFVYAKGASYLTNDPESCANCHIMSNHFNAWTRSSHHAVATCNDCHTPANIIGKYLTKANNGYHHSLAFTTGNFHEPIQIKPGNRAITEKACRKCHSELTQEIEGIHHDNESVSCIRCHDSVGHIE